MKHIAIAVLALASAVSSQAEVPLVDKVSEAYPKVIKIGGLVCAHPYVLELILKVPTNPERLKVARDATTKGECQMLGAQGKANVSRPIAVFFMDKTKVNVHKVVDYPIFVYSLEEVTEI